MNSTNMIERCALYGENLCTTSGENLCTLYYYLQHSSISKMQSIWHDTHISKRAYAHEVSSMKTEKNNTKPIAEKTTINLSITTEDKKLLKMYAVQKDKTVSDILHDWIAEKCREAK